MKVAIITGAAQGIGRHTAEVLASAGYALALLDLQPCQATLAQIHAAGADSIEVTGDVSDEGFVAHAVDAVRNRWGRADVLVNNAGISFIAPAETVDAKTDTETVDAEGVEVEDVDGEGVAGERMEVRARIRFSPPLQGEGWVGMGLPCARGSAG